MKTYVIHVSDAYEREQHMQAQLTGRNLDVTFVLEGDKKMLEQAQLEKYFKGDMALATGATSCAMKHILAYEKLVDSEDDLALILEDDIRFYANFSSLDKIVTEIKERKLESFMISIEDSNLKYVPRSQRKKGVLLYSQAEGRFAGAYLIDKKGAKNLLASIYANKVAVPIDWFHTQSINEGLVQMFWSHPALAMQGSLDGSIDSIIDSGKHGFIRPYSFAMQKCYKKLLYFFR